MFEPRASKALQSRSATGLPLLPEGLEEICVEGAGGVAAGLGFVIAAHSTIETQRKTMVFAFSKLWLHERGRLFVSGLPPAVTGWKVLLIAPRTETEALWALEEALRSKIVGLVIGGVDNASFLATRRLDLAARRAGAAALLLKTRPSLDLSAARRRWRIDPYPSAPHPWDPKSSGAARWHIILERSRDGSSGDWIVEQDFETHRLHMVDRLAGHGLDSGQNHGSDFPVRRSA